MKESSGALCRIEEKKKNRNECELSKGPECNLLYLSQLCGWNFKTCVQPTLEK